MSYRKLSDFAPNIDNSYSNDPLLYCTLDYMDSEFLHGAMGRTQGKYNSNCTTFLTHRCANNWDAVCEAISEDTETRFPNTNLDISPTDVPQGFYNQALDPITYGEQIVLGTAQKKYRINTENCNIKCEPFDPTVPNSPLVCWETSIPCSGENSATTSEFCYGSAAPGQCIREYGLTKEQALDIDNDPVMNKLLDMTSDTSILFEQILRGCKKLDTLKYIKGSRLYYFFKYNGYL